MGSFLIDLSQLGAHVGGSGAWPGPKSIYISTVAQTIVGFFNVLVWKNRSRYFYNLFVLKVILLIMFHTNFYSSTLNFRWFFGHLKNAILANSSHLYIPTLASFTTFNIYNIYVNNVYWGFQ